MESTFSLGEYISIKQLLNSSVEDDVNIGIANIENLDLDPIYIFMLAKNCNKHVREKILSKYENIFNDAKFSHYKKNIDRGWGMKVQIVDLSWDNLYDTINEYYSNDRDVKKVFSVQFTNEFTSNIISIVKYKFLDDLKINIKW